MALAYTTFTDARTQGVGNPLRGFRATMRHDRGEGRRFMLMTVKVLPSLTLKNCMAGLDMINKKSALLFFR